MSVRLKDVVATNRKALPETTDPDFSFRYIDISAVSQGRIDVPDEDLRFETAPSRARRLAEPGDTVVSTVRTYLRAVARVPKTPDPLVFSTGFAVLHPIADRIDSRYLSYYCTSAPFIDSIIARSVGVSYPAINASEVADVRLGLPPLDEQRRIADFLDTETARLDRLLDLRRRQEDGLAAQHDAAVTAAIEEASYDHEVVRLKHTGARITVGIVVTPAAWYVDDVGVPALRGVDVNPGTIKTDNLIQISEEGHRAHPKSRLRAGDVVVVRTGKAGAACAVPDALVGANAIDLLIIRPGSRLLPHYIEHIINSEQTRRFVDEFSVGTIQSHFNVGTLGELPVPMLRLRQQELVTKELDDLVTHQAALVGTIGVQRERLLERRQALITAAVTGQLDVTTARPTDP